MNITVSAKPLHIDIPVKLANVRTVYSIGALAFEGDLPASIFHFSSSRVTSQIGMRSRKSLRYSTQTPVT